MVADHILEHDEGMGIRRRGHPEEAGGQARGHMDEGQLRGRQVPVQQVLVRGQLHHQHQGPVAQAGEGVSRIHGQRRDQGQDATLEVIEDEGGLDPIQVPRVEDADAGGIQLRLEDGVEELVLPGGVGMDPPRHPLQELSRREAVRAGLGDAGVDLPPDARHPHHEELIPVVRHDAEELHPFQQWHRWILRLLHDARVEVQPAQLAVEQLLGAGDGVEHGSRIIPACDGRVPGRAEYPLWFRAFFRQNHGFGPPWGGADRSARTHPNERAAAAAR